MLSIARIHGRGLWFYAVVTGVVFVLCCAVTALGQETQGMIFGTVTDPSSAAVVSANVTITNVETNVSRPYQTNSTGYYEGRQLNAGRYRITAQATAFKQAISEVVDLPVGARVQVNIQLELGEASQSISVRAEAPLLDTAGMSSGMVMENRTIQDLPTAGATLSNLMKFAPGVMTATPFMGNMAEGNYSGARDYLPGGIGGGDFSIDGAPNAGRPRSQGFQPSPDVIQEFKVETSAFDASMGHGLGMNISLMMKTGTNQLHGSLREVHYQNRWMAMSFFQKQAYYKKIAEAEAAGNQALADQLRASPGLKSGQQNNFAGTIGGPVILPKIFNGKDKLFFFFGFSGWRYRASPFTQVTLPTMANREGDFSDLLRVDAGRYQIYDPLSIRPDETRPGHYVRTPFTGNIIPQSRIINPAYKFYKNLLPATNNDPTNPALEPTLNFNAYSYPSRTDYKAYSNRVDYNLSAKHQLFGRWNWDQMNSYSGTWGYYCSDPTLLGNTSVIRDFGQSINYTYTMSPATVLVMTVGGTQTKTPNSTGDNLFKASDAGLPSYLDVERQYSRLPNMSWSGYEGQSFAENEYRYRVLMGKADLSHIWGSHTTRMGMDIRDHFLNYSANNSPNRSGSFAFSNTWTMRTDDGFTPAGSLGHSWAAFMMGMPTSLSKPLSDDSALSNPYYAWYVQDNWRVTRRLSLNVGLRLEYELGGRERYDRMIGAMNLSAKLPITDAAQAAYAANPVPELSGSQFEVVGGTVYPGVGGVSRRLWQNELTWNPRASFAYELNSKTVLRGGYGVFHDTLNVQNEGAGRDQSFFSRTTSSNMTNDFGQTWLLGNPGAGVSPLTDPFPVRADGTRFDAPLRDSLGLMAKVGRSYTYTPFNRKHARQQRWRLGVQRQIGTRMVLEAAYAGSYSDKVSIEETYDATVTIAKTLSALPQQYWATGNTRNDTVATKMNANVTNPFYIANFANLQVSNPVLYNDMRNNAFFTSKTIRKNYLLRPFPQMNGLAERLPLGEVKTHALEVNFQRRFSQGFNLNLAYTRLSAQTADFFFNEFDSSPSWRPSNFGRPHRLMATTVYELPFGKGRHFVTGGPLSYLLGGFQFSVVYEFQSGALIDWGNLFYNGNLDDIQISNPTINQWFNTAGFVTASAQQPAAFQARVFPTRIDGVRASGLNFWSGNVQRDIKIKERVAIQLRWSVMNLQNRAYWGSPNVSPTSTSFGKVTTDGPHPRRYMQVEARLQF